MRSGSAHRERTASRPHPTGDPKSRHPYTLRSLFEAMTLMSPILPQSFGIWSRDSNVNIACFTLLSMCSFPIAPETKTPKAQDRSRSNSQDNHDDGVNVAINSAGNVLARWCGTVGCIRTVRFQRPHQRYIVGHREGFGPVLLLLIFMRNADLFANPV